MVEHHELAARAQCGDRVPEGGQVRAGVHGGPFQREVDVVPVRRQDVGRAVEGPHQPGQVVVDGTAAAGQQDEVGPQAGQFPLDEVGGTDGEDAETARRR